MKYLLCFAALLVLVSCSGASREELKKIKILEKKDLERCQIIDAVIGKNDKGIEALAIEEAKKQAIELDADSIHIQDSVANGSEVTIKAVAYQCKK